MEKNTHSLLRLLTLPYGSKLPREIQETTRVQNVLLRHWLFNSPAGQLDCSHFFIYTSVAYVPSKQWRSAQQQQEGDAVDLGACFTTFGAPVSDQLISLSPSLFLCDTSHREYCLQSTLHHLNFWIEFNFLLMKLIGCIIFIDLNMNGMLSLTPHSVLPASPLVRYQLTSSCVDPLDASRWINSAKETSTCLPQCSLWRLLPPIVSTWMLQLEEQFIIFWSSCSVTRLHCNMIDRWPCLSSSFKCRKPWYWQVQQSNFTQDNQLSLELRTMLNNICSCLSTALHGIFSEDSWCPSIALID